MKIPEKNPEKCRKEKRIRKNGEKKLEKCCKISRKLKMIVEKNQEKYF